MGQTYEFDTVPGDLFIYEGPAEYTRESATWNNGQSYPITLPLGSPVTITSGAATVKTAANIESAQTCQGILMRTITVQPGETVKLPILARGPVVINKTRLPAADYAGNAYNATHLATAIATIPQAVLRVEGTKQTEQDT